jgi:predicted alpha-1,6-mannanase (GH76 family)
MVGWPSVPTQRLFIRWDYWWQAHLIDCAVDAVERASTPARRARVAELARGHRVRNLTGWTNNYYDDMAWLTLALERAERGIQLDYQRPLTRLSTTILDGWDAVRGALPWRVGAPYFNAPANGPAGIALARLGMVERAAQISEWIAETLADPMTGLIFDGVTVAPGSDTRRVNTDIYTYCQGVTIGLDTELAVRTGDPRYGDRAARVIAAVADHLTTDDVIDGGGGGDGGLFAGILVRYLTLAAMMLPGDDPDLRQARARAANMVLSSAEAAWANRIAVDGNPLFGPEWRLPARMPRTGGAVATRRDGAVGSSDIPERDLSVQLSGWMLMEAACRLAAAGFLG